MAYFDKYIRQILSRQEAVIFPGFGSLILKESKGIAAEGKIHPPGVVIQFDPIHPKDDKKLSLAYAQGEEIDEDEAQQQLLELVDAIKFKLDKGEAYVLPQLGKFSRDDDNRIHFQKDPNWVIDPELFGLDTLNLLELDNDSGKEEIQQKETVRPEKKVEQHKEGKKQKIRPEHKATNKWKIIWIVIGSLIAVLVLILLIPVNEEKNAIEFGKDGIVIRNTDPETKSEIPQKDETDAAESSEAAVENTEIEKLPIDTSQPVQSENKYFIIAGSFQRLQNATELQNKLKAEGFPAEIVLTENRLYRVAVKGYPDKDTAIRELSGIKSRKGLEKVWIWSR